MPTTVSKPPGGLARSLLSLFVILHFGLLWIAYSSNWKRSTVYDGILTFAQPYLIGLDLGVEMVPVDWGRAPEADVPVRLYLASSNPDVSPQTILDSQARTIDRLKERQLLGVLTSVIDALDDDTVTALLASIVKRADTLYGGKFDQVVVQRMEDPHSDYEVIYQAAIVREVGKELRFVPALEPQRTIKGIPSQKVKP